MRHVVSGALGVLLGALLGFMGRPGERPTAEVEPQLPHPQLVGTTPRSEPDEPASVCPPQVLAELDELREEVQVLRFQAQLQEGELEQAGAREIRWPEGVVAAERQAAFTDDMHEVVEALGAAEVEAVDCAEYPCIAFVRADDEASVDRYFDEGQTRLDQLGGYATGVRTLQAADGTWWAAFHGTEEGTVAVDALAVNQRVEVRVFDYVGSR